MNILLLSSSNRNFPLDVQEAISGGGQSAIRFSALADFFSSPLRKIPYLAILEIGCPEDINRSILAFEWSLAEETPSRFLLLLASKYLQINEKALRFGAAEITTLPIPKKNLLFKIELQLKLLLVEKTKPPTRSSIAFQAELELPVLEKKRILKLKGPSPQEGKWNQESKPAPSGKIRWRWVRSEMSAEKESETILPTWTLTSDFAPIYLQSEKVWIVEDAQADLTGTFEEEEVYSSIKAKEEWEKVKATSLEKKAEENSGKLNQPKEEKKATELATENAKAKKEPAKTHDPKADPVSAQVTPQEIAAQKKSSPIVEQNKKESLAIQQEKNENPQPAKASAPQTNSKQDTPLNKPIIAEEVSSREEKLNPVMKWESKLSGEKEKVATTGEDQRDRKIDTKKEVSLPGSAEEIQKKEKFQKEEIQSNLRDHRKMEHLKDEEMVPQKPAANIDESIVKSKKIDFEMIEKKSREAVAEEETIESRRKNLDSFWEEEVSAKKTAASELEDSPKKCATVEQNTTFSKESNKSKESEQESLEKTKNSPNKETRNEEAKTDNYQSVAKSYFRDKEVSKKIQVERNFQEKDGKMEVEIRGDFEKLELERRIAPSKENLESKTTFTADRTQKAKESDFLKSRHFEILTLKQLNDQNSTWHPVDQFRIYFSAKHRYYGIKDLNEVFPLWIYTGELAPEFLEEEKAWKFYDRSPQRFLANDPLPIPIARFLQQAAGICEQEMETFRTGIKPKEKEVFSSNPDSEIPISASKSSGQPEEEKKPKQVGMLGFIKKVLGFEDPEA
jgi:hypothetical protein